MSFSNKKRLAGFFDRMVHGKQLRVACIGGSITTGYAASIPQQHGWAAHFGRWLQTEAAPSGGLVTLINRGVSGTDSTMGAMRIAEHIIQSKVDLVVLEFAINDQWLDANIRRQTYEGCLRQLLAEQDIAVIALFLNEQNNPQKGQALEQSIICNWYDVPCLRFSDHYSGDWTTLFPASDSIHPNDYGHSCIADALIQWTQKLRTELASVSHPLNTESFILPKPLYSSNFQYTKMYDFSTIIPLANFGFENGSDQHGEWLNHGGVPNGWHSNVDDAEIVLPVRGRVIGILFSESDQYRNLEAWLDDRTDRFELRGEVAMRQGYLGWNSTIIAHDLDDTIHHLHIRMKHDVWQGSGRSAHICAIFTAGILDSGTGFTHIEAPHPGSLVIPSQSPHWSFSGRLNPEKSKAAGICWQGTSLSLEFAGTGLTLEFASAHDRNFFDIDIDGRSRILTVPEGSRQFWQLSDQLNPGKHLLTITKRSEGLFGHAEFAAAWLPDGSQVFDMPIDTQPLIEFYGDSITAGACIEDGPTDQYDNLITHDSLLTYGAITARKLNMRYANFAVSGTGLTCSWNTILLPEVFDRWKPDPDAARCPVLEQPSIVVVNLGQNDHGFPASTGCTMSADYGKKLIAFIQQIRLRNPNAWIICAIGGMPAIHESAYLRASFIDAVSTLQTNDNRLSYLIFDVWSKDHPRFDVHARLAEELTSHIKTVVTPQILPFN